MSSLTWRGWAVPTLIGITAGIVGILLVLVAQHLWMDHRALHELAVIEMQRQQRQAAPAGASQ